MGVRGFHVLGGVPGYTWRVVPYVRQATRRIFLSYRVRGFRVFVEKNNQRDSTQSTQGRSVDDLDGEKLPAMTCCIRRALPARLLEFTVNEEKQMLRVSSVGYCCCRGCYACFGAAL